MHHNTIMSQDVEKMEICYKLEQKNNAQLVRQAED